MRNHDATRVAEKAQDLYRSSKKFASRELSRAEEFIHEKPVLSTLLGVGLGFVIASFFRSRD